MYEILKGILLLSILYCLVFPIAYGRKLIQRKIQNTKLQNIIYTKLQNIIDSVFNPTYLLYSIAVPCIIMLINHFYYRDRFFAFLGLKQDDILNDVYRHVMTLIFPTIILAGALLALFLRKWVEKPKRSTLKTLEILMFTFILPYELLIIYQIITSTHTNQPITLPLLFTAYMVIVKQFKELIEVRKEEYQANLDAQESTKKNEKENA